MGATMTMPDPPITPGAEMTIKQFLDLPWMRRIGRAAQVFGIPAIGLLCSAIGTLVWMNYSTASQAQVTATQAVEIASEVQDAQEARAQLADQRAEEEKAWRERFDRSLTSINRQMTRLTGEVGQLKGIVIREGNAVIPWSLPPPAELFPGGELDVASEFRQEDR
jgi:uncharacterized protein YlxW (UPF0749 family)